MKERNKFKKLIKVIIEGIEDVKGNEISLLDLTELENRVCDYFIICDGNSNTQVSAIINSVTKKVSKELKNQMCWYSECLKKSWQKGPKTVETVKNKFRLRNI